MLASNVVDLTSTIARQQCPQSVSLRSMPVRPLRPGYVAYGVHLRPLVASHVLRPSNRAVAAAAGAVRELEGPEDYTAFISADGVTFVDFYTSWCGPCKLIAPTVEKMAEAMPSVAFAKVRFICVSRLLASSYLLVYTASYQFHVRYTLMRISPMHAAQP
jgi:thiol-disulfide isomerase/thioredoxin